MRIVSVLVAVTIALAGGATGGVTGGAAGARDLPQLFDVRGVATDDVLNIRAAPTASATIIGALPPDARGIEVVARNAAATWGQVNTGEQSGWVSLRYMEPRGVHIDHYNLPVGLSCFGTEPFWSLRNQGGSFDYSTPEIPGRALDIRVAQDSGLAEDLRRMVQFSGIDGPATAFIYPAACSDGMSDRAYGLSIGVMMSPGGRLLNGCCSLARSRF